MDYIIARLKEPSTYAALAAISAMLGFNVDPGLMQSIASVGAGAAGIAAVFMRG